MDYRNRTFQYRCKCGNTVNVFIDFGVPQEFYRCRRCGQSMKRDELT